MMSGVVQNQDSYMKGKIAQRWYYDRVGPALRRGVRCCSTRRPAARTTSSMPYRCDDAEYIIVGMGCYMETCQATVDYLRETRGIQGRLPERLLLPAVPGAADCRSPASIARRSRVLERMDDPLSTTGNHLTREIKAAFCDAMTGQNGLEKIERDSADLFRRGRAGQPRRAAGRHHRRRREHDRRRAGLFLRRHRSCAGAEGDRRSRSARAGHVLDARPFASAASARSRRTRSSPRSPATCSARTCRPIRSTARKRRACRRRTT